tara:strand:- start:1292 stop:1666 length:375 start_codon:yes stop_codon:yes gene_type:complete
MLSPTDQKIFEDSTFSLRSTDQAWAIPPDLAVMKALSEAPKFLIPAVGNLWIDKDPDEMNDQDCADAMIIVAILVASNFHGTSPDHVTRHFDMKWQYRKAFETLEQKAFGAPTSEELKEMFGEE